MTLGQLQAAISALNSVGASTGCLLSAFLEQSEHVSLVQRSNLSFSDTTGCLRRDCSRKPKHT